MRVFALADLHLSEVDPKPMTIFGPNWAGHPEVIFQRWPEVVREEDVVLLPGDLSWAMGLSDALVDLRRVAALPGKKVILRGNHDYWWSGIGKLRAALPPNMWAIQNDAIRFETPGGTGLVIAGTRGWETPGHNLLSDEDERLMQREAQRLEIGLKHASRLRQVGDHFILMLHYPPFSPPFLPNPISRQVAESGADMLVYGHLHNVSAKRLPARVGPVPAHLVAADALGFVPKMLFDFSAAQCCNTEQHGTASPTENRA